MSFSFLLEGVDLSSLFSIGGIVLLFVFFYFFMIRPQKKKEKEDQEMRDALTVGDEVTTIGGIIGKVVSIREETFVLETTKAKTHIRFLKGAIRSVDVRIQDTLAPKLETPEEAPAQETEKADESK
ncbi:MAG: preprotein translocase subunit YajC [Clostridia bacterium]|nr:preprotein translocase subunit YajC [Clostridia bacterium]